MLGAWEPANWIALTSIIVAPAAALAGAWLNGHLAAKSHAREQQERWRADAAAALGPMIALLLDSTPQVVLSGDLREYSDPASAVAGLYERWLKVREPLLVVTLAQSSGEVRDMGIELQATAEMILRKLADEAAKPVPSDLNMAIGSGSLPEMWKSAMALASQLAERLVAPT